MAQLDTSRITQQKLKNVVNIFTAPVSISYINAPSDHQSTAFPCPLRVRISGALEYTIRV